MARPKVVTSEEPVKEQPQMEKPTETPLVHKQLWLEIKNHPEYGFLANQEGYDKLQCVLLYKIVKLLEEK